VATLASLVVGKNATPNAATLASALSLLSRLKSWQRLVVVGQEEDGERAERADDDVAHAACASRR
jgi:hypothetical protein